MRSPKKGKVPNSILFFHSINNVLFPHQYHFMDKIITIFLIDDDEDDRKLFFDAVRQFDETINCLSASNGKDGLLYLKDEGNPLPDFIFLDLRMPGLSGEQCLQEIKADP